MSGKEILKKLTSRKFIAMLLGVALGCAMAFGIEGEEISTVAGAVTSVVSLVYYMFTEGKIDRAALSSVKEELQGTEEQDSLIEDLFGT
ncbi:MAG: hypothetical protein IJZ37_06900 [Clostridia bacterium]|nr:hypothetical protein [Clostridia bacterium]MBQ8236391.1 hypothetical protein [Clostridia bacterium]